MRRYRILATALNTFLAAAVHAQPAPSPGRALSPEQIANACAPPPMTVAIAPHPFHVIGAQDTVPRAVFAEHDLLIIDAGTAGGMQLGQQYYLRRPVSAASYPGPQIQRAVITAGWIRLVAANETTAIAAIEHECGAIHAGDYLEPFETPAAPSGTGAEALGDPDFGALSRVVFGDDERTIASPGDVMMIDHGSQQGVLPGARLAIYRDVRTTLKDYWAVSTAPLPLASIGEAVVVSASATMAVVRVVRARDAVRAGDYAVPRKP